MEPIVSINQKGETVYHYPEFNIVEDVHICYPKFSVTHCKNGNLLFEYFEDKYKVKAIQFPDGSVEETHETFSVKRYTNGVEFYFFNDGVKVKKYKNGTELHLCPDGTRVKKFTNGGNIFHYPDGNKVTYHKNGIKVIKQQDGKKIKILRNGDEIYYDKSNKV